MSDIRKKLLNALDTLKAEKIEYSKTFEKDVDELVQTLKALIDEQIDCLSNPEYLKAEYIGIPKDKRKITIQLISNNEKIHPTYTLLLSNYIPDTDNGRKIKTIYKKICDNTFVMDKLFRKFNSLAKELHLTNIDLYQTDLVGDSLKYTIRVGINAEEYEKYLTIL